MRSCHVVPPGNRSHARPPSGLRRVTLLAAAALLLSGCTVLSGCTAEPAPTMSALPPLSATVAPPSGDGTASPSPSVAPIACEDGLLTLGGVDEEFIVTGSCRRVEVAGTGLDVDLTGVQVSIVSVRGDENEVDARELDALTLEGQDNEVDLGSVGRASLRGDRNSLDVTADIDELLLAGNDNEVEAAAIGSADVSGDRNEVVPG